MSRLEIDKLKQRVLSLEGTVAAMQSEIERLAMMGASGMNTMGGTVYAEPPGKKPDHSKEPVEEIDASKREEVDDLYDKLMEVYDERNQVVAALSKIYHAHWYEDDTLPPEEWVVIAVSLPDKQWVTWHAPQSQLGTHFAHLDRGPNIYDGHETDEKYRRLSGLDKQWR